MRGVRAFTRLAGCGAIGAPVGQTALPASVGRRNECAYAMRCRRLFTTTPNGVIAGSGGLAGHVFGMRQKRFAALGFGLIEWFWVAAIAVVSATLELAQRDLCGLRRAVSKSGSSTHATAPLSVTAWIRDLRSGARTQEYPTRGQACRSRGCSPPITDECVENLYKQIV